MRHTFFRVGAMVAMASLLGIGTAFARSSNLKMGRIDIISPAQIANGTVLKPGTYTVETAKRTGSSEVMFYRNNKLVAQAPARIVNTGQKSDETQLHFDNAGNHHVITQIDLRGSTDRVMFGGSQNAPAGS